MPGGHAVLPEVAQVRKMTARPTVRAPAPTTVLVPGLALVLGMALALLGGVYMYPVGGESGAPRRSPGWLWSEMAGARN